MVEPVLGMNDPTRKRMAVARKVAAAFRHRREVKAVCVGGSTAVGMADTLSDLETVVLCSPARVLAVDRRRIYANLADDPESIGLYSWGRTALDFLEIDGIWVEVECQDIDTVESWIANANTEPASRRGKPFDHYRYAILSTIHYWRVLVDKGGVVARLKKKASFPDPLRRIILKQGRLFGDPQLIHEHEKACMRGDVPYAMRCLNRIIDHFTQVAFALNRGYYTGDKRTLQTMKGFRVPSAGFYRNLEKVLVLANDKKGLERKRKLVDSMFAELKVAVSAVLGDDR
ncbi:MAG: DUF4037 domain-containing protein [Candidatus Coatesbacteria bacterium]